MPLTCDVCPFQTTSPTAFYHHAWGHIGGSADHGFDLINAIRNLEKLTRLLGADINDLMANPKLVEEYEARNAVLEEQDEPPVLEMIKEEKMKSPDTKSSKGFKVEDLLAPEETEQDKTAEKASYLIANLYHWSQAFPIDHKDVEWRLRTLYRCSRSGGPLKRARRAAKPKNVPLTAPAAAFPLVSPKRKQEWQEKEHMSPLGKIHSMLASDYKLWKEEGLQQQTSPVRWPLICPHCPEILFGIESLNQHLDRHAHAATNRC